LSQFATVEEVKKALSQYKIWSDKSTMVDGVNPEIHFLITDKSGHGLVVEYINGEAKFYDVNSNIKVMTNAPTYDWQLTNLRNYLNLNNKTIDLIKLDDVEVNDTKTIQDISGIGQGNGFLGIPGDYSPPSRFVKMAVLAYYSSASPLKETTVSKVSHILHNVDIAKGTIVSKVDGKNEYAHTAYVVIKDLNKGVMTLTSYDSHLNSIKININTLDKNHVKYFDKSIDDLAYPNKDISKSFMKK
jgi:choloylglycine hydrolase